MTFLFFLHVILSDLSRMSEANREAKDLVVWR
jgi:hypothetical protein